MAIFAPVVHRYVHKDATCIYGEGRPDIRFKCEFPRIEFEKLGKSPIRTKLGLLSASEAQRRARILAGHATMWMEDEALNREILSRSLAALAAELDALKREERSAGLILLNSRARLEEAVELGEQAEPELLQLHKKSIARHTTRLLISTEN